MANFPICSSENKCLRCGHHWYSYNRKDRGPDQLPKKCARCRSPLWNVPRKNKMVKRDQDDQRRRELEQLTWDRNGYQKLYDQEKQRRQALEAENARLWEMLKKDGDLFEELETELRDDARRQHWREKFKETLKAACDHADSTITI